MPFSFYRMQYSADYIADCGGVWKIRGVKKCLEEERAKAADGKK